MTFVDARDRSETGSLFRTARLGSLTLKNRLAVAPMTRTSADPDGFVTDRMRRYYASFAEGGFGLVTSEGIYTDEAFSQGYANQPGLATADQARAWRPVVEAVRNAGGRMVAQLMHAGALSQANRFRTETVGPSAIRPKNQQLTVYGGSGPFPLPRQIEAAEIGDVIAGFARAARFAKEIAGFDGVEIHGANGYIIDQFLTDYANSRADSYGGSVQNQVRLAIETIRSVREAVGSEYPVGIRISQGKVNDFHHRWAGGEEDAEIIFSSIGSEGVDFIHTTEFEAWKPAFDGGAATLASLARRFGGVPVIANGSLHDPDAAARLLEQGDADIIALGRGALANADWPSRVRNGEDPRAFDPAILTPLATLANADAWAMDK